MISASGILKEQYWHVIAFFKAEGQDQLHKISTHKYIHCNRGNGNFVKSYQIAKTDFLKKMD